MRSLFLSLIIALACSAVSSAQNAYEPKIFTDSDGYNINYQELVPENVKPDKKYPLVIFMHGAGERGSDNKIQLLFGSQMFLNPVNREKHPAYVIFPQCPTEDYWSFTKRPSSFIYLKAEEEIAPVSKAVMELIDTYLANPNVDKSRVYIMGLSMGGMATFDLVSRYPEKFAAAIPICGAADTEMISKVKGVSWRIFHGDADDIVPVECSRRAYKALKEAGADVEYIEFPGCNHGSWNPAFNYPGFMDWLFKQKR